MRRRGGIGFAAAFVASAAFASPASNLPSRADLAKAIALQQSERSPPVLRHVRCYGFEEEPTEFGCRFEMRDASGRWRRWSTYLAVDASGYQLIDDPAPIRTRRRTNR